MSLYREILMDHYKNPRHKGKLKNPDIIHKKVNMPCGDEITIYLNIKNNKVEEISFEGFGCVISQSSASILTDKILNKNVDDVLKISDDEVLDLIHIPKESIRRKCALLSLYAIREAIDKYMKGESK